MQQNMHMSKDLFPGLHPLHLQRLVILFVNVGTKKGTTHTVSIPFPLNICFAFIFQLQLSTKISTFPKKKISLR